MFELDPEKWTMQGILWGFFVFGALIAGVGLIWGVSTAWFLYSAEKASGVIVDVVAIRSTRSPGESQHAKQVTSYYPVVEFRDSRGVVNQAKSSRAARSDHFKRGDEAVVYYDAENPEQAFIQDTWMLWFAPGVILGGGLIWMLAVWGMLIFMKRFDDGFTQAKARFYSQVAAADPAKPDNDSSRR
ncbi:DUF3592 domain-containing protein [Prosthecobacter sp.]|uniref:DUF3592 domain-containing protein n=1 Tax=Prosthecobacter sp. TaxID=1965333 RepID=UPI002489A780|nr:DUF3592 domain-containing protein [Prosthecobacter sp.]MDI1312880.1 DUF3592 domain-containing protein [Prosthecobacter sp.]